MAFSRTLTFDQGIPQFSGEAELFDEHLDRVETLVIQYTEDVQKKQGPLAPRLYNALKGEAYTAAKAANIAKKDLAKKEGVELLITALKVCIQGAGPTRVGEIFDKYFDGGARRGGTSIGSWLTMRSEVRQQLMLADPKTVISDNVEAYFLLKLSNLTKGQRSQVLASIGNKYDPKLMGEAMRVQFSDIHKAEGKYQRDSHHGKGGRDQRRYAYAAEQEYDEDDRRDGTWDETADAEDEDDDYDDGGMTDFEY